MNLNEKIAPILHIKLRVRKILPILLLAIGTTFADSDISPSKADEQQVAEVAKTVKSNVEMKRSVVRRSFSGKVTYYAKYYDGHKTASGERHSAYGYHAAHKTLPFGTLVRVTVGNKSVVVKINDRGPFGAGRVLDLSYQAAKDLGILNKGVAKAKAEVLT